MNVIGKSSALLSAGILAAVLSGFAADENPPRFELFLTYGPKLAGGSTIYTNAYDPHPGYKIRGSYARQTITLEPAAGGRLTAGGTWHFGRRLGVRLAFVSESQPIDGTNTPFDLLYLYTSMIPPNYTPIEAGYVHRLDWPATEGAIKEWGGSFSLVWRLPVSDIFEFSVAGGLSLTSAGGRVQPLGYTEMWEGGHGVMFYEDYFVYLRLPPKVFAGAVLGLEAAVRLSEHFWLRFEADYRKTGTYRGVPEIAKALSSFLDEADAEAMKLLESRFDLQPLELSLSRVSFGAGIVVRL